MTKKGFTLTELLVVIVVLGIITGISIPLVRNIQLQNQKRQFDTYKNAVTQGAKLYTDSHDVDFFQNRKSGCDLVSYGDLKDNNLIKDIKMKDVTCEGKGGNGTYETYVKIVKYMNKYYYNTQLVCRSTKTASKPLIYPTNVSEIKDSTVACVDNGSNASMTINVTPSNDMGYDVKRKQMTISITSDTGISTKAKPSIKYGFGTSSTISPESITWTSLVFDDIPGDKEQFDNYITQARTLTITSDKVTTPSGATGDLYLYLKVDNLSNYSDENWAGDGEVNWQKIGDSYYRAYGKYQVDNTLPTITPTSTVVSSTSDYNNLKPKLKIETTDDKTSTDDLLMCVSIDNKNDCSYSKSADRSKYEKYDPNKTLSQVTNTYDGSEHTIVVYILDKAGNVSNNSSNPFKYKVYKNCESITYRDGTTCTKKCGSGTFNRLAYSKYGDTSARCSSEDKTSGGSACNTQTCCSKTTTSYGNWSSWGACSKKCGTGTQTRTRTVTKKSSYDDSVCSTSTETGSQNCNTQGCCSSTTTTYGNWSGWSGCSKSCGTGTQTRTRSVTKKSNYDGSVCSTSTETGSQNCNTQSCDIIRYPCKANVCVHPQAGMSPYYCWYTAYDWQTLVVVDGGNGYWYIQSGGPNGYIKMGCTTTYYGGGCSGSCGG